MASLQLWTKTINGAAYSGKICIWIFKRVTVLNLLGQQVIVDVPAINLDPPLQNVARFEFSRASWPTQWTEIGIPMHFIWPSNALTGLNIVGQASPRDRDSTRARGHGPGDGLEFMYDHPSFDSRLEVQSSSQHPALSRSALRRPGPPIGCADGIGGGPPRSSPAACSAAS